MKRLLSTFLCAVLFATCISCDTADEKKEERTQNSWETSSLPGDYKLNNEIVAKNRRKRIGQTYPSLHEWFIENKTKLGLEKTRQLQSKMQVTKSKRSYRNPNALQPGTLFLHKGKVYVLNGTLTNGAYLRAFGDTKTNFNRKDCTILKSNCGLVFMD